MVHLFFIKSARDYQAKIEEIKANIKEEKTAEIEEKEEKLKDLNRKIRTFSKILEKHFFISNIFSFLEKTTHPKVIYTSFDLNPKRGVLSLAGETENFLTLGQQILFFRESQFVSDLKFSEVSLTKEGKVSFSLDISLKSEIFQWKE